MSSTVAQVIVKVQRRCKGLSQARGTELYNDVLAELAQRAQFRNNSAAILITQGVREYALGSDVWQIHEAYFQQTADANSWLPLYERSTDAYIEFRKGWRATDTMSTPYGYYVQTQPSANTSINVLGLDPMPSVSSSGGYPNITIYYTGYVPMVLTDTVPMAFLNDNALVTGMRRLYAMDNEPQNVGEFEAEYESEVAKLTSHIKQMQSHGHSTIIMSSYMPRQALV